MSQTHEVGAAFSEVKEFPEMLSTITDQNLEVFQITTDLDAAGNTRGGFFTPDGKRFIFARHRDGGLSTRVEYTLCELDDGFKLRVLTDDDKAAAPVVSSDSKWLYYLADHTHEDSPRVVLKRQSLETFKVEQMTAFDKPVDGIGRAPQAGGRPVRGISRSATLRGDDRKMVSGFNFYHDDADHFAPVIIDLETLSIHGFDWEPFSWRVGGRYVKSDDPDKQKRMFMGKSHRSQHWSEDGKYTEVRYGNAERGTLHVVSEEGEILETVPIGGEGEGVDHPYQRGKVYEMVSHSSDTLTAPFWRGKIQAAVPIACPPEQMHEGMNIPGARRYELTRKIKRPDVCHMSWHDSGKYVACDSEGWMGRGTNNPHGVQAYLWLGTVVQENGDAPHILPKYLLHPRSSWNSAFTENCQELSPDRKTIFFNSDFTCKFGNPQVFAVRGYEFPEG